MRKILTLLFIVLAVAAAATTVLAADYDRYERGERGYPPSSPPPRGAYAPPPQHAVHGQGYFFGHLGLFDPNDSGSGLQGYDSGSSFDFGFGSRVSPVLAIEGTFGAYGADRGPDEVRVVPLTFGVRLIVPHPIIEPYVGGGLGLYIAHLEEVPRPGFAGIDDNDSSVGGYASLGLDAWLNQRVALNFEGRYHWVEPQFDGFDVKVGGWTASMGVRISF